MQSERTLTNSVTIDAPPDAVWDAITTPAIIKQWFFGVDTESDWQVGGPLVHRGSYQGRPYEDKGEILRFDPPKVLAHTHWSDGSGLPDAPENYQEVTWTLEPDGDRTTLTVTERNLPSDEAALVSEQGWAAVLEKLKELLEG